MLRWNSQKKQETIFIKKCMYFSDHHLISISYSFPCLLKMYVFFLFFPKSLPKMSNFPVSIMFLCCPKSVLKSSNFDMKFYRLSGQRTSHSLWPEQPGTWESGKLRAQVPREKQNIINPLQFIPLPPTSPCSTSIL